MSRPLNQPVDGSQQQVEQGRVVAGVDPAGGQVLALIGHRAHRLGVVAPPVLGDEFRRRCVAVLGVLVELVRDHVPIIVVAVGAVLAVELVGVRDEGHSSLFGQHPQIGVVRDLVVAGVRREDEGDDDALEEEDDEQEPKELLGRGGRADRGHEAAAEPWPRARCAAGGVAPGAPGLGWWRLLAGHHSGRRHEPGLLHLENDTLLVSGRFDWKVYTRRLPHGGVPVVGNTGGRATGGIRRSGSSTGARSRYR